ncbi:MAG: hypothetical protein ABIJ00_02190 [Candidatus Eisenbacteria bacterium]
MTIGMASKSRRPVASRLACTLVAILAAGCAHMGPAVTPVYEVTGTVGCKDERTNQLLGGVHDPEECVQFDYDGESVLTLRHVNIRENCAVVQIAGEIEFGSGNVIRIEEWPEMDGSPYLAFCTCLFDVDYRITGLGSGEYRVMIGSPGFSIPHTDFELRLLDRPCRGELRIHRTGDSG